MAHSSRPSNIVGADTGACSDDDDGGSGSASVENACNTIVRRCGGEGQGFGMDECLEEMGENSFDCVKCVVDNGCSYEEVCHEPSDGCDVS